MQVPADGRSLYSFAVIVLLFSVSVLSGCGAWSTLSPNLSTTPPPKATATVSVSPSNVMPGQTATLTWSSTDAIVCTASGAWSGKIATSGSINVVLPGPAAETFSLYCSGTGFPAQASATLSVAGEQSACAPHAAVRSRASKRTVHSVKTTAPHS